MKIKMIGNKIKEARELAGLTQEELAQKINLQGGKQAVYKYENGDSYPLLKNLPKIAEALGCELIIEFKAKKKL